MLAIALVVVLGLAVPAVAEAAPLERQPEARDYVPGEIVVRFERGVSAERRLLARRAAGVDFGAALPVPNAQLVEVDGTVNAAVRRLEREDGVAYAQPNYRYRTLAVDPPDDSFFGSLWGLSDPATPDPGVNALEAWETTRGAGQVVAVVDTGVALDHPDLIGNLWTNPDESPGGGDDDGNGHGDDVAGYDFVAGDTVPDDYDFHGTHVAGTIAAAAGNGLGVAGVAPDALIMPVRVLDGDGQGSSADVAAGISYAAREGADVINLSLGGPAGADDQLMSDAVDEANARNATVVAAAGNDTADNGTQPTTPCTLPQPNLICVAAVDANGGLASFSNYGTATVDVAAPGTGILSAEADYDDVIAEPFDSAGLGGWSKAALSGTAWGASTTRSQGSLSAADSPGAGVDYQANSNTQLVRAAPLDLAGRRGCRMRFGLRYEIEDAVDEDGVLVDALFAGALAANDGDVVDGYEIAGDSGTGFEETEVSIELLDGRDDVLPAFALFSDATLNFDGAYVDDLHVLCRAATYSNAAPPIGNYAAFSGTSMATPHVAGVAALAGASDPSAGAVEIVRAIAAGVSQLPSLRCRIATGGSVDAAATIALVQLPPGSEPAIPSGCPAPTQSPPSNPPPGGGEDVPAAERRPPTVPVRPDLSGAKGTIRVSRRGGFAYSFRATPGLTGDAAFRTRKKAVVSRRAHLTIGTKAFSVRSDGRVTVKLRLSRRELRILRRNEALRLRVTAVVRDAVGLSASATKRLTLKPPRR